MIKNFPRRIPLPSAFDEDDRLFLHDCREDAIIIFREFLFEDWNSDG